MVKFYVVQSVEYFDGEFPTSFSGMKVFIWDEIFHLHILPNMCKDEGMYMQEPR